MSYLIFRGVSTASLGNVYVSQMPSHKKASLRTTEYYVKGRDGALHVNEGYANYDIQVVLVLLDAGADKRQIVNAWADGSGLLVTSDDLTKAYKATVKDEIRWKRVKAHGYVALFSPNESYVIGDYVKYEGTVYRFIANHSSGPWDANEVQMQSLLINGLYDTATITFNCQPFMYESTERQIGFYQSGVVINPGSADSMPLIKVEGSGDVSFSINNGEIQISGMESGTPVFIDCENGYVWAEGSGGGISSATMTGDIPYLKMGENFVTIGEGISLLTLTPLWRWI